MADPKIKFDIIANAEGRGEVDKLTASLEKLDQAIDPAAAARAQELAAELQRLGDQEAAIARFRELGTATEKARSDFAAAESAAAALRAEIAAAGEPTTAQAGRMEKLSAAVESSRVAVLAQDIALQASQGRLSALGIDSAAAAKAEAELGAATKAVRAELSALGTSLQGVNARQLVDELQRLGQQQQAVQQFRELGTATDKARVALTSAEQALEAYRGRIAGIEAPTTAQINTQQRLAFAVDDARAKFAAQASALEAAGGKLSALGVETGNLAAAEERLRTAAQGTLTQIEALGRTQAAVQRFQELAASTEQARAALIAAEAGIEAFRSSMTSATAPTAAEAAELERLTVAARAAQQAVQQQALAQAAAGTALRAAGVDTERLIAAQARGREQLTGTAAATQQLTAQLAAERAEIDRVTTAWQTLGVRSSAAVQAEVTAVKAALAQIQAISKDPVEIRLSTAAAQTKLKALGAEMTATVGGSVDGLITKFAGLGAAIATIGFAAKPIFDLATQTETLRRVLTQVEGSAEGAERQMAFLREAAQTAGVSVSAISDSFVKFESAARSSGISTQVVNDVFAATTRAAGNLGLSSEKVTLILDALGQMASKGVVSMEELRQQLGDSLPGALGLAAKGLGLTQAELIKLVESGQLLSRDLLPALAKSLNEVGGSGTQVEGLAASFNRLKNIVVEAGQALIDGPLGSGAGVLLTAFAGVLRDTTVIAVGFSNALSVTGKTLVLIGSALSGNIGSFQAFKTELGAILDEAAAKQTAFSESAYKTGEAAKQAGADAAAAGRDVAEGAGAYDTAAKAVAGAAQAHTAAGAAIGAAGAAAGTSAQAHTALAGATTGAAGAATNATVSWAKLSVDYATVTGEMERQVKLSEKTVMSKRLEGEAAIGLAKISGDTFTALQAEAAAAEANAAAALNLSSARQTEVAVLKAQLDAEIALARQLGDPDGTRAKQIEAIQRLIDSKSAEAESSKQLAAQTEAESNARSLAIKTYGDNSGALDELRKAYEYARDAVGTMKLAQEAGLATQEQVTAAEKRAAAASNLYRDAVKDVAEATTRKNTVIAASSNLTQAALGLEAARARSAEATATSLGLEVLATQKKIDQKRIEIKAIEDATSATVKQADASIAAAKAEREAISATDPLLKQKQQEIDARIKNLEATKLEAEARKAGIPAIEAEITALLKLGIQINATAGSLSQLSEARNASVKSILGDNTYDKQGFATDSNGQRIVSSSQANVPEGYRFDQQAFQRDADVAAQFRGKPPDPNNPRYLINITPISANAPVSAKAPTSGSSGGSSAPAAAPQNYTKTYSLGGVLYTAAGTSQQAVDDAVARAIAAYNPTEKPTAKPGSTGTGSTSVTINVPGLAPTKLNVVAQSDAEMLAVFLGQLEQGKLLAAL